MRTVQWKIFSSPAPDAPDSFGWPHFSRYYTNRRFFTPFTLSMVLLFLLGLSSFNSRNSFVMFCALLFFLGFSYLQTRRVAQSILVRRKVPEGCKEYDLLEVEYEIVNSSPFSVTHSFLSDCFSGSRRPLVRKQILEALGAGTSRKETLKIPCNGGMGLHRLGPVTVSVSDPLGLFEFNIEEDTPAEVFIHPKIEKMPSFKPAGSKGSLMYGAHDVHERGMSVNFMRVREYVRGDPIKQVSWKLSFKHQKLMVKEFEKIVNAEVTVILDLDERVHVGRASESTWEYARDIVLSVVSEQVAAGNSVQILSQRGHIPFGRGQNHAHFIALSLAKQLPGPSRGSLIQLYWDLIPKGSTVVYVGPVVGGDISLSCEKLGSLKAKEGEIFAVLIDGPSFLSSFGGIVPAFLGLHSLADADSKQNLLVRELFTKGIPTVLVKNKADLGKTLLGLRRTGS